MSAKASRVSNAIWDQYQDEIIAFYAAHTLKETMEFMNKTYSFHPTEDQYTRKLKSWGIRKYLPGNIWADVDCVQRKRSEQGKASNFAINKRKYTQSELGKEIARHVPLRKRRRLSEDVKLPDYITVSTPPADSNEWFRELLVRDLPWYQYTGGIQTFITKGPQRSLSLATDSSMETGIRELTPLIDDNLPSLFEIMPRRYRESSELKTYIPIRDANARELYTKDLGTLVKSDPLSAIKVFLELFVFLSTNNLFYQSELDGVCEWIVQKGGTDALVNLCMIKSPSMTVFARRILCSAIGLGNIALARRIFQYAPFPEDPASRNQLGIDYLSVAVTRGQVAMVDLLCDILHKTGIPLRIEHWWTWDPRYERHVCILRMLLNYGANPETFIAVELLLVAGARVDLYLPMAGGTALQVAVSRGHLELVECLMRYGADPNFPRFLSPAEYPRQIIVPEALEGPVQIAARRNDLILLQYLLDHGGLAEFCPIFPHHDVGQFSSLHVEDRLLDLTDTLPCKSRHLTFNALQYAVLKQNVSMVSLLLSKGAIPDSRIARSTSGTPLQIAARLGNLEICQILMSYGANVNALPSTCDGRTAVQGAAESGSLQLLSALLSVGAQMNAPAGPKEGMTALQAACRRGHTLVVGYLLAQGADLNARPSPISGLTPIQAAATNGDARLVKNLIDLGVDVNDPQTEAGSTALLAATRHRSLPLLELLLQHGANASLNGDYLYESAFEKAASLGWLEGMEILLKHGADITDTPFTLTAPYDTMIIPGVNKKLLSPLGWAIHHESKGMVTLLLQHNVDVLSPAYCSTNDDKPLGPLMLQRHPGWENSLRILVENDTIDFDTFRKVHEMVDTLPPLLRCKAIKNGWDGILLGYEYPDEMDKLLDNIMDLLIKSGAQVEDHNNESTTLLQRASRAGHYQICSSLLGRGAMADIPATVDHGTPLQEALKYSHVDIANLLLQHGADVNAAPAENHGVTALQAAAINGMMEMAIRLLEAGADVRAPAAPNDGRTAIDGAAERGYWDMVQLLLNAHGDQGGLKTVCDGAAGYAQGEGHFDLAAWLRKYPHG
ncbi:ankyrin repeat-containing domain protein [Aspergillus karnatakaensis]|uniref:ankyrin repeat-containing domain protein n=1 Tax=Aspergillus karnatakaensis TaxID=1810916 RepID=UPI003CCD6B30